MKFDVKCVAEYLLNSNEVYTVRGFKSKNKFSVVEFEGKSYMRERIKAVVGQRSILNYVGQSGFDTVNQWWDAIKTFNVSNGHLYHVTLLEDETVQSGLPDFNRAIEQELADCDRFMTIMSNEEYANIAGL